MKKLLLAAKKGAAESQFNLGVLYDNGWDDNNHGLGRNRAEAIKWLLRAARQGLPRAQTRLAEIYADGADASEDYIKACTWFLIAATQLSGARRQRAQTGYDKTSSLMTPAQIARAKRLAQIWKPKPQHTVAAEAPPRDMPQQSLL